ncbi:MULTISPECIES: TniQ family protein [Streptomyces]|uniref:TniQ family protein n=1 Tax=Streptomyces TaxID=1883 RepID=UPI00345B9249
MTRRPSSGPLPAGASTSTAPLPRSLDPLQEESLNGYVLRLSHRLGVSPDHILRRTGLADLQKNTQAMAKAARSTVLPAAMAAKFAAATRLTLAETTALTLAGWAPYYPPINRVVEVLRQEKRPPQLDGLFATTARYCPVCLAGDGSSIQDSHGGAWQRAWRLPVFFACLRHQRFLEHLCPTCHRPVGGSSYGHLISLPTIPGLHPAQCRQRRLGTDRRPLTRDGLCQARLDYVDTLSPDRPGTELLALQEKIAAMLAPQRSAVLSGQYFTELQLVTALVLVTWPRARPEAPNAATNAADQYIAEHHMPEARHQSNAPPIDARACAAFLHAADTILTAKDLRTALIPLAPVENRTRTGITPTRHHSWDDAFKNQRHACSERFVRAAENLVPTYRRGPNGHRIASSQVGYEPEHVPAFIPQEWADRHLRGFTGASERFLRRTAAAFLVRRARGGTLAEAVQYLGIRASAQGGVGFGTVIGRWSRSQDNLHAFELAVDAIADELVHAACIDYQHRRRTLADWALPPAAWSHMVDQLPIYPGNRAIADDRKRLAVTAYIWAHVTQGEHVRFPCPPHIVSDPTAREDWRKQRNFVWRWLHRTDEHPYYRQLKPLLDAYAAQLNRAVDTARSSRQLARSLAN